MPRRTVHPDPAMRHMFPPEPNRKKADFRLPIHLAGRIQPRRGRLSYGIGAALMAALPEISNWTALPKRPAGPTRAMAYRVHKDLAPALAAEAQRLGTTVPDLIRAALVHHLTHLETVASDTA